MYFPKRSATGVARSPSEATLSTLALTGATGQLGRIVIAELLEHGTAPGSIVALVRDRAKAADLAAAGISVREADYAQPEQWPAVLAGVDRLLLISSSTLGERAAHHGNVIAAAERAGVGYIIYTSILNAGDTTMLMAEEHKATEQILFASSIPAALLRNGWYTENLTAQAPTWLEHGGLTGAAGNASWQPAERRDYAAAAAAVLESDAREPQIFELAGDEPVTMQQVAAIASQAAGRELTYTDLSEADYADMLVQAGLPAQVARVLADSETGIKRGELKSDSGDLTRLIGRPTTPVAETVGAAVESARRP